MGGRRRAESASKNVARVDWCTPDDVLECVRECGPIGLDPCTNEQSVVQAATAYQYTELLPNKYVRGRERVVPGNGLTDPWTSAEGSTYVNHPFSAEMVICWDGVKRRTNEAWARRAAHQAPSCPGGIFVLTPANPCSLWWGWYWDHASLICFWDGRLTFRGAQFSADFEIALVWFQGGDGGYERRCGVFEILARRGRTVSVSDGVRYAGKRRKDVP